MNSQKVANYSQHSDNQRREKKTINIGNMFVLLTIMIVSVEEKFASTNIRLFCHSFRSQPRFLKNDFP